MKKWEYALFDLNEQCPNNAARLKLDAFGEDGWELVDRIQVLGSVIYALKRPIKPRKKKRKEIVYGK